jgi:hypothetical protein
VNNVQRTGFGQVKCAFYLTCETFTAEIERRLCFHLHYSAYAFLYTAVNSCIFTYPRLFTHRIRDKCHTPARNSGHRCVATTARIVSQGAETATCGTVAAHDLPSHPSELAVPTSHTHGPWPWR